MTNDHASPTGSLSEQPTPGCSAQDDPSIQAARDVLEFVTRVTSSTKIASNRQNAKRSTGPRTTRGKAKSRLNALTHRGFATLRLIPGEDECAYESLCERMLSEAEPKTSVEHMLVEQIIGDLWRLRRVDEAEGAYFEQIRLAEQARELKSSSGGVDRAGPLAGEHGIHAGALLPVASVPREHRSTFLTARLVDEQTRSCHELASSKSDPGKLMLDGMVDPERAFPFGTLEAIRRALVRGILRKNDKLAELQRVRRQSAAHPWRV